MTLSSDCVEISRDEVMMLFSVKSLRTTEHISEETDSTEKPFFLSFQRFSSHYVPGHHEKILLKTSLSCRSRGL